MQAASTNNDSSGIIISADHLVALEGLEAVRAYVDFACRSADGCLVLVGWLFDPTGCVDGFAVLREDHDGEPDRAGYVATSLEQDVDAFQLARVPRPDVAQALSVPEDEYGFVMVLPAFPAEGQIALALSNGQYARLPFTALEDFAEIGQAVDRYRQHSGVQLETALRAGAGDDHPLTRLVSGTDAGEEADEPDAAPLESLPPRPPRLKFHVECVLRTTSGLLVIGWSTAVAADDLRIIFSGGDGWSHSTRFQGGEDGRILVRTFRPDVLEALSLLEFHHGSTGFVFYCPIGTEPPATLSVEFEGGPEPQEDIAVTGAEPAFPSLLRIWLHAGAALREVASRLPGEAELAEVLDDVEATRISEENAGFSTCEQALLLNNRTLVLHGWIAKTPAETERIEVATDQGRLDITTRVRRYVRPDLFADYPWSRGEALGFVCILDEPQALACDLRLKIVCRGGESEVLRPDVEVIDWPALGTFINRHPPVAEPLLRLLAGTVTLEENDRRLAERIASLRRGSFFARHRRLPVKVEQRETAIAAIDRAYPLGDAGLLIFGWRVTPKRPGEIVTMRGPEGEPVETGTLMLPLPRQDVAQKYRPHYPGLNEWCGFVCLAPFPTRPGEARAMCFDFGRLGEVWLKVPTDRPMPEGVELAREILGRIPAPERLRHNLYDVFSGALGPAIEAVSRSRPPFAGRIEERQFGTAVEETDISVIVPLYGRCDFLRHQLAHFVDDPDFAAVDLIYVVDDPAILAPTLELASQYHPLFEVPFRVVWYGENRGFAGANNIGASVSRGRYLVLMNSDVIPQQAGWLATLRKSLETLPEAGAVGPLLQFGDGSIQHAGMYPRRDSLLPGFLLNAHRQMGMAWNGGDEPSEPPMLTAACLMLRKADYLAVGGLDEGYIVGDFEDSDLCLALRKRGWRLYLEPKARLWHLERQSQDLDDPIGQRQMLTLFNGWRYNEKIRAGVIADPAGGEL